MNEISATAQAVPVKPHEPPIKLAVAAVTPPKNTPFVPITSQFDTAFNSTPQSPLPTRSPFTGYGAPPLVHKKKKWTSLLFAVIFLSGVLGYVYWSSGAHFLDDIFKKRPDLNPFVETSNVPPLQATETITLPPPKSASSQPQKTNENVPIVENTPPSPETVEANLDTNASIGMIQSAFAAVASGAEVYLQNKKSYQDFCTTSTVRDVKYGLPAGAKKLGCNESTTGYLLHVELSSTASILYCSDSLGTFKTLDHEPSGVTCE